MPLRKWIREGIPGSLVLALALGWAWMKWSDFRGWEVRPGSVDSEVVMRYYDRELRISEAAQRGNAYERWMTGADGSDESLGEARQAIREIYLTDLGKHGEDILDTIALRLGEAVTPSEGSDDRSEARERLLAGNGQAWDYELFLNHGEDAAVLAFYRSQNDRLLDRAVWSGNFGNAILLAGLVAVICLARLRKADPLPGSRIPDSWAATSVLGAFFLAEILLKPWFWILDLGYRAYYGLGGFLDIYPLYDALWRAFPVVLVAIIFLKYPHRILKVFGLGKRIDWLLLTAALAIVNVANWLLYVAAPPPTSDPTDFIGTTSADLGAFALSLLSSVVLAPVFEEFAFRGFLFQGLKSKTGPFAAAAASSFLFALTHTQYDLWGWISVGMMGLAACYLTHRTGSLKTGIALHAVGNLLIAIDVYLFYQLPV